ncbi:hypothetical protein K1Y78_61605, partial [Streptomyces sp. tea 10]|nr:hypothetical protein [Streptomyces sp. tea 10]
VTAAAASTVCSVIMVIDAPAHRPDSAAVFESAGWSVVLVTRWTDVDAAWLATTRGATLLTPPPPDPGTRQLRMDEMMGHARGRATA